MATTLSFFRPPMVRASVSSSGKPDPNIRKPGSPNWWAPIFGWSSDPDYVNSTANSSLKVNDTSGSEPEPARPRSKFAPGRFTEEKAKQLRMKTLETSTFHDVMYHSAIASRLASDVSERFEK